MALRRGEYGSYAPSGGGPEARIRQSGMVRKSQSSMARMIQSSMARMIQSSMARIRQSRAEYGMHKTVEARIWYVKDSQGHNMARIRQSRPEYGTYKTV